MNFKKVLLVVSLLAMLVAGTVVSAGALTPLKVASLKAYTAYGQVRTYVKVQDFLGRPVAGAAVRVSFEKGDNPAIVRSGLTNLYGAVVLSVPASAGQWTMCVESITKTGYVFDPAQDPCVSLLVP